MKKRIPVLLNFLLLAGGCLPALDRSHGAAFDYNGDLRWTNGVVHYQYDPTGLPTHQPPDDKQREQFERVIRGWQKAADINFVKRTTQPDYIYVSNTNLKDVNFSWVAKSGGAQPLWIDNWDDVIILHEMGHALGLTHEHQRSDRDNYIDCWWWNAIPTTQINFLKENSLNRTEYDYLSLMHYDEHAFALTWPVHLRTLSPKNAAFAGKIGQRAWFGQDGTQFTNLDRESEEYKKVGTYGYLSPKDREGIRLEYGNPNSMYGFITSGVPADLMPKVKVRLSTSSSLLKDTVARMVTSRENPALVKANDEPGGSGWVYSFSGLPHGTYRVTPELSGYKFTPASATFSVSGGSTADVNFSAVKDEQDPPVLTMAHPGLKADGITSLAYQNFTTFEGTVSDSGSSVQAVYLLLNNASGNWYNWTTGGFETAPADYREEDHRRTVPNNNWTLSFPGFADGSYYVQVSASDLSGNTTPWLGRWLVVDKTPPTLSLAGASGGPVSDFTNLGGTAGDLLTDVTVRYSIVDTHSSPRKFWNGTSWQPYISNENSLITAKLTGNEWGPANGHAMPGRGQTTPGTYEVIVRATDASERFTSQTHTFTRTPQDGTVPDLSIESPANNAVLTNTLTIPPVWGYAADLESGMSEFEMYLMKAAGNGGGFKWWNGFAWVDESTALGASYDKETWRWDAPVVTSYSTYGLPTGANLPNGSYQIQIYGKNGEVPAGTRGVSVPFSVNIAPPESAISSPAAGSIITTPSYTVSGTATSPVGINRVILFIRRNSDAKYWNGSTWIDDPLSANLLTEYNAAQHTWTRTGPLPAPGSSLANGSYLFTSIAFDEGGNRTQQDAQVTVDFHQLYTWTRGSYSDLNPNNNNEYWDNPANWSPAGVPASEDNVIISLNTGIRSATPITVHRFGMSDGFFYFDNAAHALTITTGGSWTGGTLNAVVNIEADATFDISGAGIKAIGNGKVINNFGNVTWTGPGLLRGDTNATWNNKPGSSFTITGDGDIFANNGGGNVFNNNANAKFIKMTGAGGTASGYVDEWTFNNAGGIDCREGTLHFNTSLNLNAGTTFAGAGRILLNATTNLTTEVVSTGNPELIATLNGNTVDAGFTGSAPFVWSSGTINGRFTLAAGSVVDLTTSSLKSIGNTATFTNRGRVNWKDGGVLRGDTNATFNNEDGAVFDVLTDGDIFANNGGGNIFNNKAGATFQKSVGAGGSAFSLVDEWTFNNASTISCLEGMIHFNTSLNLNAGSTFAGPGRLLLNGVTNLNTLVSSTAGQELVSTLNANTPDAGFTGTRPLVWSSGKINGTFTLAAGSVVDLSSATLKAIGNSSIFTNLGRVNWKDGGLLRGDTNATFNNEAGAVFDALTDGDIFANNGGGNVFHNKAGAVFRKSGKSTTAGAVSYVDEWTFNNSGTIGADDGVLQFHTALNLNDGGILTHAGALDARVLSTHYIVLTGTTTINNITFQSSGDWHGNTAPGTAGNGTFATLGLGVFEWSGGTAYNVVNIAPGSAFLISGNALKAIGNGSILNNYGNANLTGSGDIRGNTNATLRNFAVFNSASDANFINSGGGNRFVNAAGATFRKMGGMEDNRFDWAFDNAGTAVSSIGAVALNGGGTSSGTFTATSPGVITFTAGQHDLVTTARFEGTGRTQVLGGVVNAVNAVDADTTAGLLEIAGGTVTSAPGGSFNALGNVTWTGGTIAGTFNAKAGSHFLLTGEEVRSIGNGSVINNSGEAVFTGPGLLRGNTNATWNNKPGSSFSMTADGDVLADNGGGNVFNNEAGAAFVKTSGAGGNAFSLIDNWTFNNAGTITSQQGTVHFNTSLNLNNLSAFAGAGRILLNGITNLNTLLTSTGNPELIATLNGNTVDAGFTGSAPFVWSSGTINGRFTLAAGSVVDLTTSSLKAIGNSASFTNRGRVNWKNDGRLRGDTNATFNNESGGIFEAFGDGDIFANNGGGNVFNNKAGATFHKSGGAAGGAFSLVDEWTFNNASTISCLQGTIQFNTSLNLNAGSTFAGPGRVLLNGVTNLNTLVSSTAEQELVSTLYGNTADAGFTGTRPLVWSSGLIIGRFTLAAGSVVDLSSTTLKAIGNSSIFTNLGRVNWKDGGLLRGDTNATFNNEAGAVFDALTDGDIFANNGGGNVFHNKTGAVFRKSGRSTTAGAVSYVDEWTFNNSGTIAADDGVLQFHTALNLNDGGLLTHAGALDARVLSTHYFVLTGTTGIDNVTFQSSGDWHGNLSPGTAGNGTLATVGSGVFEWSGGTAHNVINIAPGSRFNLTGGLKAIGNGGNLKNGGTATWTGGTLRGDTNARFSNLAGASFIAETDADFTNNGGGNVFSNSGTFTIGAALGVTDMNWSYVQTSSGRLVLEVSGSNAATPQFDQLRIAGSATLGGELNVTKLNGYAPAVGTNFSFLTSAGRTGNFANVSAPGFALDYTAGGATLRALSTDPLEAWAAAAGLTGADALPLADPDKDGVLNLMEYALGTDPKSTNSSAQPKPAISPTGHLELRFMRRHPSNVTYIIENPFLPLAERIIAQLQPGATVWTGSATVTETGDGATRSVTVSDPTIVGTVAQDFLRLRVVGPQ